MNDIESPPIDEEPASARETLEDLLTRTRRDAVPIRRSFIEISRGRESTPGPLAAFVTAKHPRALDLYLLLHSGAALAPWDVTQPAMSWARMLDMPQTAASETTVSRNWSWLEEQKLIRSERDRRVRKLYLLLEDGSGGPFEKATGKNRGFFKLPYAYFTDRIHQQLKLPGKATLLICLAQNVTFTLPTERAAEWYGISADTLERGLDELRGLGLIKSWSRTKKAPRSRYGYTTVAHYAMREPFARAPADATAAVSGDAAAGMETSAS